MIAASTPSRSHCHLSEALEGVIGRLSDPLFPAITTGFRDLDFLLHGGLPVGAVSAVAGRPSMGREEFSRYVAFNVARQGGGVLYFSLERSRHVIALHGLAEILDVEPHWLSNPSNQTDALGLFISMQHPCQRSRSAKCALGHKGALRWTQYSTVGGMIDATTTLTRAGLHELPRKDKKPHKSRAVNRIRSIENRP